MPHAQPAAHLAPHSHDPSGTRSVATPCGGSTHRTSWAVPSSALARSNGGANAISTTSPLTPRTVALSSGPAAPSEALTAVTRAGETVASFYLAVYAHPGSTKRAATDATVEIPAQLLRDLINGKTFMETITITAESLGM